MVPIVSALERCHCRVIPALLEKVILIVYFKISNSDPPYINTTVYTFSKILFIKAYTASQFNSMQSLFILLFYFYFTPYLSELAAGKTLVVQCSKPTSRS